VRDGLVNVANNQIGIIGPISLSGTSRAFGIIADNSFESNSYISNNIIKNISGQGAVFGIYTYRNVTHYIQNNDFTNWIFADNTLLSPIRVGSGTIYINGNNLSGIQLINTGANTQFYGIYANGGTVYISNTSANIFGTLADPIINNGTGYTSLLYKSGGTVTITNQDFEYVNGNAKVSVIRNEAGTITFTNCSLQNLNLNTGSDLAGIDLTGGSLVMQGTSISGVNITSPSATAFSAISLGNNSTATLGTTTSNTISNISSSLDIPLRGIWYNSSGTSTISSNSIFSITSSSTGTNAYVVGIEHTGTGNVTMQYNTIHTLNSSSERIISNLPHAAQALYVNSASISPVSRNLIYEIQSVGTVSNFASGVVWGSANSTFFNNTIHTIRNTSSGSGTIANGIHIYSPTSAAGIYNNMILMGEDGENPEYAGIRVSDASVSDANIYFNSVFISGAGSASNLSHAFIRESGSLPVNLVNNILVNLRTGSSTHYAVSNLNTADWNSNTNCYYTTDDTHTTNWNGLALNLDDWTSTVSNDTASVYFNPDFVDESAADLRLETNANCMLNGIAITISGITNDIDGDTRVHSPTPSDIGVDDFTPTGGWGDDVWRGFASTDWATANNWSCENVPTAASNVTINRATNYPIIASAANISITDLTINSGGRLSISSAALLNVSGDIVNNGNLYIQSTLTQTGSLLNDGNITGSGLCTFNRLLSGGEFHYISSPVSNASHTIFSTYGEDHNYTNPNFYLYDDNKPLVDNWLQGWDSLTCRTSDIEVGRGYAHWYTYQATYGIRGNLFNTGNQTISVTNSNKGYASDGFNLIGNPYPSAIDAQEFIDLNATINGTIDGTLYFWDDDLSNGAGYNTSDYATWNVVGVAGAGGVAPNGYIAPTQGFFVYKSTPGIANIEFNNIMRVSNAPVLFKNKESIGRIYLTVQSPNMQTNEILVAFTSLATDKFDRMYDSPKLRGNQNLALYSLLNSYELAIQSIGELSLADTLRTIPLGIENTMSGEYQFSAYIENLPAWANVYLEDRVTGLKNLLGNEPVYIKLPEGKIDNRFRIIFANRPLSNASETPIMEENNFKIYAFGDKVYVKMPLTELQTGTLNVYNSLGQMISTMNYTDVNFIEAPLFVNRGVYLIEWQTLTNKISSKVSIR